MGSTIVPRISEFVGGDCQALLFPVCHLVYRLILLRQIESLLRQVIDIGIFSKPTGDSAREPADEMAAGVHREALKKPVPATPHGLGPLPRPRGALWPPIPVA